MFQSFVPRRSQVRGNRTGVKTLLGISSLASVTPVGICQGARKHLRQSQPSSKLRQLEFRPSPQSSQRESDRS
ncbi:hypothetical protein M5D96_011096 [Drosophila gunungcola]|uniref:Uncharacterized protein n=1 Tax=Drosophila gunungcola TaxID=103775 RepID=A0A9P9YFP9_9MUSC|nr:hypothetical protein M5D96_011096 [Drosophila gunungcola]